MKGKRWQSRVVFLLILVVYPCITAGFSISPPSQYSANLYNSREVPDGVEFTKLVLDWIGMELVSDGSTYPSLSPDITVDKLGNFHVVWHDETNYSSSGLDTDVVYRLWNSTTGTWHPVEVVSTEQTDDSGIPTIAVEEDGDVHVAWNDWTNYSGAGTDRDVFYKWRDSGLGTWNPTVVVSNASADSSKVPDIAVDTDGNVHVVWYDQSDYNGSGTDDDVFYRRLNATTDTWTETQVLSTFWGENPSIGVDPMGNAHVVWKEYLGGKYEVVYRCWNISTDQWSTAEIISTDSSGEPWYPEIAVDPGGHLHVAWTEPSTADNSGPDEDLFYKRWNTTTRNWTSIEVVSKESNWSSYTHGIAADSKGNAHFAWVETLAPDAGIYYSHWNATTGNWTSMEKITTESAFLGFNPTIAVNGAGYPHIAWEDRTNYSGAGTDWDIFYKKMIELPNAPVLTPILPNPNSDGNVSLTWSAVNNATSYYIYRDTSPIITVNERTPIGSTPLTNYIDMVLESGVYYYAIVARTGLTNSSLSNCEQVVVILQPPIPGFELFWGILGILTIIVLGYSKKRKISIV